MSPLALLAGIITIAAAMPLQDTLDDRSSHQTNEALPSSTESPIVAAKTSDAKQSSRKQTLKKDSRNSQVLLALLNQEPGVLGSAKRQTETGDRPAKKTRKHKAIFVDYPFIPRFSFEADYEPPTAEERTSTQLKKYQESNIFYIRLPPTPYMFVPGLGYVSQPPTYSTAGLRPQIGHVRPIRPLYQRPSVNPFIKLPIDFVSNGKPTSVYQWQRKPGKKPDSPITNLDGLSTEFVSNGKPTSVYQWQTGLEPIDRPEELVNSLDKGPYVFNGKPASLFLLRPDGSSTGRRTIRYPDFRENNAYY